MNFQRLTRGDAVAMVAALALLLLMSLTWYSTIDADAARQIEDLAQPRGGDNPELQRIREDATFLAERADRNAYEVSGTVDRVILAGLLATILLAVSAAWLRAGDRRFDPPITPSGAAALAAGATAVLVAYRMVQEPGQDAIATVEPAALLALALLAVIAFACRAALLSEMTGTAWAALTPDGKAEPEAEARAPAMAGRPAAATPLTAAVLEPPTAVQRPHRPHRPIPTRPAPAPPPPADVPDERISLATATVDDLRTLDGIGPALARRIVEHRERVGGFDSVKELGSVDGIGAKRLADLEEALRP